MSFRMRLIITIVLLIAITFSLGGSILIYTSFETTLHGEIDAALDSFKNVLNTIGLLSSADKPLETDVLGKILAQMTDQNMGRWQAVALWSSGDQVYGNNDDLLKSTLSEEKIQNRCAYIQVEDAAGNGLVVESQITVGDRDLRLQGRFDLSRVYRLHETQQHLYIVIYLAVLVFSILISVLLSFALTGKLRKLTAAVKEISGGSLSTRSNIRSDDEFGQLSRDFDAMADKLQETIDKLEANIQQQETFMGDFAHELKTPMTSIIGFADLLQQGNLDENTRMMAAQYIYSEGHRLERLSFKLLDLLLLKKDTILMKPVNIQSFVADVVKAMDPNLRSKGIQLVCRSTTGSACIEPDLVKSLLYNLIDNASKAVEKNGIIVLKAAVTETGCAFQVIDNGRGMKKEQLGKITEAFYRVDKARSRAQGGAGLGLALCKQIVDLHHGQIQFDSVPGKGTIVKVTLNGVAKNEDA